MPLSSLQSYIRAFLTMNQARVYAQSQSPVYLTKEKLFAQLESMKEQGRNGGPRQCELDWCVKTLKSMQGRNRPTVEYL